MFNTVVITVLISLLPPLHAYQIFAYLCVTQNHLNLPFNDISSRLDMSRPRTHNSELSDELTFTAAWRCRGAFKTHDSLTYLLTYFGDKGFTAAGMEQSTVSVVTGHQLRTIQTTTEKISVCD